jgi:hypothetical protein
MRLKRAKWTTAAVIIVLAALAVVLAYVRVM